MTTLVALGRLLRPVEITGQNHLPVLSIYREHGIVPKASRQDNYNKTPDDLSRYLKVSPGDLVVNKMKAWSGSVAVSAHEGIVSGDYLVCRVTGPLLPPYLHYVVRSSPFVGEMRARSTGIRPNQERLYWDDLSSIAIEVPSIVEQRRIADFLDDQTSRVGNIATARTRQIERLVESRSAEIAEVLEPWTAQPVPVRYLATKIGSGKTPAGGADAYADRGVIFLRSQNVHNDGLNLKDVAFIDDVIDEDMRNTRVRHGDVLLNITGASLGRCTYVPEWLASANVNQHVCIIRPERGWQPSVIAASMSTGFVQDQIATMQVGGNRDGLNFDQVGMLRLPLPPQGGAQLNVQGELEAALARTRRRIGLLEASIALLQEFKRSLISAAVSGEFDVSTASGRGVPA